jgi:hypothetical protein
VLKDNDGLITESPLYKIRGCLKQSGYLRDLWSNVLMCSKVSTAQKMRKLLSLVLSFLAIGLSFSISSKASNDIAVIGWGSLIWNPAPAGGTALQVQGQFAADGPILPLAFTRISGDKRLTLVIDPHSLGQGRKPSVPAGANARALHANSIYTLSELNSAIKNLREREGCDADAIGYVNLVKNTFRINQLSSQTGDRQTIRGEFTFVRGQVDITSGSGIRKELLPYLKGLIAWSKNKGYKATIWTDLQRNFQEKSGHAYSLEAAKEHLRGLSAQEKAVAHQYIQNAPVRDSIPESLELIEALR